MSQEGEPKTEEKQQKRSFYGVFDPKEHQEKYERKLDKAWEELHFITLENEKKSEDLSDQSSKIQYKSQRANLELAKKLDKMSDVPGDINQKYGSTYFMRYCSGCHGLQSDSRGQVGAAPPLGLIYGRLAGSDLHYPKYSSKMASSQVLWTRENLRKFMMDPSKVIKGSRCVIEGGKGLEHEAEAWDIAEFLRKFSIASIIRLNSMGPHNPLKDTYQFSKTNPSEKYSKGAN